MKISDLIRTLQEVLTEHGDIEVNDRDTGERYVSDVHVWMPPRPTPEFPPDPSVCLLSFGSYVIDYETWQEGRYDRA